MNTCGCDLTPWWQPAKCSNRITPWHGQLNPIELVLILQHVLSMTPSLTLDLLTVLNGPALHVSKVSTPQYKSKDDVQQR